MYTIKFSLYNSIWQWYGDTAKNKQIFTIFFVVWSFYGVVYFLPNTYIHSKNMCYNILDVIAKVGFGLLIWFEIVQLRLTGKLEENENENEKNEKK